MGLRQVLSLRGSSSLLIMRLREFCSFAFMVSLTRSTSSVSNLALGIAPGVFFIEDGLMSKITIDSDHIPPSVNNLFINVPGRGRVPSKAYKAWRDKAGLDYNGLGSVSGRYSMVVTIDQTKVRRGSDITNRAKALEDICVTHKIVEDDSLCQSFTIRYGECHKALRIEIEAV